MDEWRFHVTRPAGIRLRQEDEGRYLLYHPGTDELHVIGPVEKEIYDLCDGRSIDDVVVAAIALLPRPAGRADEAVAREVLAFLSALHQRTLIVYE